jgi:hypothetical protein
VPVNKAPASLEVKNPINTTKPGKINTIKILN